MYEHAGDIIGTFVDRQKDIIQGPLVTFVYNEVLVLQTGNTTRKMIK